MGKMCNQNPCPREAAERVWCRTWIGAERGPIDVCSECAKVFKPEHNKHCQSSLDFHWGADADWAYHELAKQWRRYTRNMRNWEIRR